MRFPNYSWSNNAFMIGEKRACTPRVSTIQADKPQTVRYGVRGYARDGYRVNLGCVEGLDVFALEIGIIDGKALPMIEEPG